MIRIDPKDLARAIALLNKEANGGPISFKTDGVILKIGSVDRNGKDLVLELFDVSYPTIPRVTRTESL